MECRVACGACCIAPSITGPLPGMPQGKAAGERCIHLDCEFRCALFGDPSRPALCNAFAAEPGICGGDRDQALVNIYALEHASNPHGS
ncbi:YkgJ family cysteine cluster protein [Halioglobus maricola]|uniref:YkgJ family cysteine cluster protein n=1 Tax=Halioglobus maricola TaxID=2601894 RepID=A0A5P9NN65_9GAMM|nr:YkgJ family cysteine cluster protein [Halioglobus maricola]QFU77089.1 YkgJ family cysteine cluster protein [Halioglobus maricola]